MARTLSTPGPRPDPQIQNLAGLGQLIRNRRLELALRIDDAAHACGVAANVLSRLENGGPRAPVSGRRSMSQAHVLHVCTQAEVVGQLEFDAREDRYGFQYTRSWLDSRMAYYLAPAIPLIEQSAGTGAVHRFLENLLPEGRALDIASIHNQVSKSNTFALIRLLGKEPVGAFSFMAHDASPEEAARIVGAERHRPPRRPISNEELSQRIRERDAIPFPVWDGKVRLSLAGYQDKLQVLVEGEQLSLADGPLSSTHLLKPESRNPFTPCMVANEHFCMSLAARLRLPVAPVAIRRIPEPILLIERFDRTVVWDDAQPGRAQSVNRLHVIDGCQALDLPSTFKYERNFGAGADVRNIREGVSFARLFTLLDKMVTPATARPFILRWAILQLLLGNSDAHGKAWRQAAEQLQAVGMSAVTLCDAGGAVALFGVRDRERAESAEAIAGLRALQVHPVMLTGDDRRAAQAIAQAVGIDAVHAEQLPADKQRVVGELAAQYGFVGMVGDGINDAPALARADIGFAMGAAGTATALEAADVAIMDDDPRKLTAFIRISRRTVAVLRQNIALALGIKAVFLALAVAGEATLWMAIFADVGASLLVVFNGLRVMRVRA